MESIKFFLALPRLHSEFVFAEPEISALDGQINIFTLWPGLPRQPDNNWSPDYLWSAGQAEACLRDFERTARDGAKGTQVQAWVSGKPEPQDSMSPAEARDLASFASRHPESGRLVMQEQAKIQAQTSLILAWFQESQILALQKMEREVSQKSRMLAGWLGEGSEGGEIKFSAAGPNLPRWQLVLSLASFWLAETDDRPNAVLITDRDMARELWPLLAGPDEHPLNGMLRGRYLKPKRAWPRELIHLTESPETLFVFPSTWVA